MEIRIYDTRLVRKYARLLELEYMDNKQKIGPEKLPLLLDTIRMMQQDVMEVFEREGHDYWWRAYELAEELLAEEGRARTRAAEVKRKNAERRERERVEAAALLQQIAA